MIQKEEYLKAKQIVQEYEKQLNISDVSGSLSWIEKDKIAGVRLIELRDEEPHNSILFERSSKVLRQLIIEGIDIGLNYR
jgi:SH3-like domain-containing protein